jgi:hypothetical protein
VAEPAVGLSLLLFFTAPYEDIRLKKKSRKPQPTSPPRGQENAGITCSANKRMDL